MAVGPIGGIAFLKINGLQYQLRGELEVQPNTTENDWMANQDGSMSIRKRLSCRMFPASSATPAACRSRR